MKKHPVDDLFNRRLSELEKKPSSAAWDKIQTKTKKERRLAGWIWYAAASVVITLVAGYIVWNSERSNIEMIGKEKKIAVVLKPAEVSKDQKPETVPDVQVEVKENPVPATEIAAIDNKRQLKPANNVKRKVEKQINADEQNQNAELQNLAANNVQVKEESVGELPSVEKISPKTEEVFSAKVAPTPVEPTRIVIVAVETNDQLEEKPKLSKFSKVFRQLKNARAGERVDWEEVGFNPKSLVAKVDNRLRNGEEKVSEKYQNLKEKTKL